MGVWTVDDLKKKGFDENGNRKKNAPSKKQAPKEKEHVPLKYDFPWAIFIEGQVPSSKNSRINGVRKNADGSDRLKANGKKDSFSMPNKTVREYKKIAIPQIQQNIQKFHRMLQGRQPPYNVYFKIIRKHKITAKGGYRFDYHNAIQIFADLMEQCGWIENDDAENIIPHFIPYGYDPERAGMVIMV